MQTIKTPIIILLMAFMSILSYSCLAQEASIDSKKNLIQIAPFSVLNKIRASYDYTISNRLSAGLVYSCYYGMFPGQKFSPNMKFFFSGEAPNGLFASIQLPFGFFRQDLDYDYYEISDKFGQFVEEGRIYPGFRTELSKKKFTYGYQITLGYQLLTGRKKNIPINVSLGLQYLKDIEISNYSERVTLSNGNKVVQYYKNKNINVSTSGLFKTTGPGAIFTPSVTCGYAF